ncbi:unnamed protein product [Caenorhabditis brenneri]
MSLFTPSTGILETHVTWEDVEEAMQKALGTEAVFGNNRKATNIGDLRGFMSRIALIDADWQGAQGSETLPAKFAVKISSQLGHLGLSKILGGDQFDEEKLEKLQEFTMEFHDREVEAYKCLMRFGHPDIPYTRVYHLKPFTSKTDLKGFMIFDFVPNVYPMGMHQSIPADDLRQLVRGVATFSALGESLSQKEKQKFGGPEFLEIGLREFFSDEQLERQFQTLHTLFNGSELVENAIQIFWQYTKLLSRYTKVSELLGFKLILNHCDLWQTNVLHSMGDDGKLKLEAIIDWQGVARLPAGFDMARMLVGCLSAKDRQESGDSLLQLYHRKFTEVLGKELFTFEELRDTYNLFFPLKTMIIAPLIMSFLDAQNSTSDEDKKKYREENKEKLQALLEDVVEVHEQNLNKYPEFFDI